MSNLYFGITLVVNRAYPFHSNMAAFRVTPVCTRTWLSTSVTSWVPQRFQHVSTKVFVGCVEVEVICKQQYCFWQRPCRNMIGANLDRFSNLLTLCWDLLPFARFKTVETVHEINVQVCPMSGHHLFPFQTCVDVLYIYPPRR